MKYFVLGALASGMLLYGMSMLYGVSGTLNLSELASQTIGGEKNLLFTFGLVFVLVGIAFKLGVAPFHMWVPDVYQGASLPTTLFISSAPKLAAFAMAVRVLVDGLPGLMAQWSDMLVILAVASIAIGNIVAIAQTNIKRMLAYSTVSHMGFMLLGMIAFTNEGYAASMFYVFVYSLASMSAFGFIILATASGPDLNSISDFSGLGKKKPLLGFLAIIVLFSLAGVPPFGGFWAKWFVLKELVASGHVWLATVAVIFSLIGAYYYLRVIKVMFFDEPQADQKFESSGGMGKIVFGLNTTAIMFIGIFPSSLMGICLAATSLYGTG
jgi:NADH-quinone oxidoreductase subunit N